MYTETAKDSHIWKMENEPGWEDGWYFSDETENFGNTKPYATQAEAEEALDKYCRWLNGEGRENEP